MDDEVDRTCYVCNFTSKVTSDLLEELFTQVGPVEKVVLLTKSSYRYAMVIFEDEESVMFAVRTLDAIKLFNTPLTVKPRRGSKFESEYREYEREMRDQEREFRDGRRSGSSDDSRYNYHPYNRRGYSTSEERMSRNPAPKYGGAPLSSTPSVFSSFSPKIKKYAGSSSRFGPKYSGTSKYAKTSDGDPKEMPKYQITEDRDSKLASFPSKPDIDPIEE